MRSPIKYWGGVLAGFLLIGVPSRVYTACQPGVEDLALSQAVERGDYEQALTRILKNLPLTPEERQHFHIIRGLSAKIGESHGQADPDSDEIQIDPGLFEEGESGACQGVIHELTHLRRFRTDRSRLKTYYASHSRNTSGWAGCEPAGSTTPLQKSPVDRAYDCLEDNALLTHAAAADIEAVLAQRPYAVNEVLRDEDVSYLKENLHRWIKHATMIRSTTNNSYYLPVIKQEDVGFYCRGSRFLQEMNWTARKLEQGWKEFCVGENLKQQ